MVSYGSKQPDPYRSMDCNPLKSTVSPHFRFHNNRNWHDFGPCCDRQGPQHCLFVFSWPPVVHLKRFCLQFGTVTNQQRNQNRIGHLHTGNAHRVCPLLLYFTNPVILYGIFFPWYSQKIPVMSRLSFNNCSKKTLALLHSFQSRPRTPVIRLSDSDLDSIAMICASFSSILFRRSAITSHISINSSSSIFPSLDRS